MIEESDSFLEEMNLCNMDKEKFKKMLMQKAVQMKSFIEFVASLAVIKNG